MDSWGNPLKPCCAKRIKRCWSYQTLHSDLFPATDRSANRLLTLKRQNHRQEILSYGFALHMINSLPLIEKLSNHEIPIITAPCL
jgi:hypothetical protein